VGSGLFTRAKQTLPTIPEATNKSYRVDGTYLKVNGRSKYLYRAVDSSGQTIDFLLVAKRDAAGAKRFFRKIFQSEGNPSPRVIDVDKNRGVSDSHQGP
jgi:transposase, IS6 family